MFGKRKQHDPFLNLDEEAAALPRGDENLVKKSQKYRVQRWGWRNAWIISLIATLLALFAAATMLREPETPEVPGVYTEGKPTAIAEVRAWLGQDPSPVPDASIVSWDGYTDVPFPELSDKEKNKSDYEPPTYHVERHHISLEGADGQIFMVDVEVAIDSAKGAHIIGAPSLLPQTMPDTSFQADSPWPGMEANGAVPEAVNTSVIAWQKAFTSGNADELRLVVGDPDSKHTYLPLRNVDTAQAEVVDSAFYKKEVDGDQVDDNKMLARVELTVDWAGQTSSADPNTTKPVITYDLLITNTDSGSPKVVAWGGPGEGQKLEPYSNATTGSTGSDDQTPLPSDGAEETEPGLEPTDPAEPSASVPAETTN